MQNCLNHYVADLEHICFNKAIAIQLSADIKSIKSFFLITQRIVPHMVLAPVFLFSPPNNSISPNISTGFND
jgi:hypothetical protein